MIVRIVRGKLIAESEKIAEMSARVKITIR